MNATEINHELQKVMNRALSEGVIQKKVGFETVIGLLETHKQALYDWRVHYIAQQVAEQAPRIIAPGANGN
jgi:hypothetical protein